MNNVAKGFLSLNPKTQRYKEKIMEDITERVNILINSLEPDEREEIELVLSLEYDPLAEANL